MKTLVLLCLCLSCGGIPSSTPTSSAVAPVAPTTRESGGSADNAAPPDLCLYGTWTKLDGQWVHAPVPCSKEPYIDTGDPGPKEEIRPEEAEEARPRL